MRMMLPPPCSFPREGFALPIASEACLIATKHLHRHEDQSVCKARPHRTHESALIRIVFMNVSADVSCT